MAKGSGTAIEWHNLQQVLDGYDLHCRDRDNIYFSIWQGGVPKFTYDGGDQANGRVLIEETLAPLQANGSTALYTLKIHPALDKDGYITDKSPVTGSGNFRLNDPGFYQPATRREDQVQVSGVNNEALDKIVMLMQKQDERMTQLEQMLIEPEDDENDMEEVPDPEDEDDVVGAVNRIENAVAGSPLLQEIFGYAKLLTRSFAKKMGVNEEPNYYGQQQQYTGMNGVEDQHNNQAPPPEREKVDFHIVMKDLVQGFPELPGLLAELHHVQQTDADIFVVAKKKLIKGVTELREML